MSEVFSALATAMTLGKKLTDALEKTRDADTKLLVADLNLQLADPRMFHSLDSLHNCIPMLNSLKSKARI